MVTRKARLELSCRAISSFISQDYNNKELIIVHDDGNEFTEILSNKFPGNNISVYDVDTTSLGKLRNQSIEYATGDIICQWDDDDFSHPYRLSIQVDNLIASNKDASYITMCMYHMNGEFHCIDMARGNPFIRTWRVVENSLLAFKDTVPLYPQLPKGEDTEITNHYIERDTCTTLVDIPYLFCTTYHGNNTWDVEHHTQIIQRYRSHKWMRQYSSEIQVLTRML